jgi:hypothetical protein
MFGVSAEETTELAEAEGLSLTLKPKHQDGLLGRAGVSWTRLAFSKGLGSICTAASQAHTTVAIPPWIHDVDT